MNFNEIPLKVPSLNKCQKFFSNVLQELKAANTADEVTKIMKKINKFSDKLETEFTVISIRYSIDTRNEEYKKAMETVSELSPQISSLVIPVLQEILNKPFRQELVDVWGEFLFKKYQNNVDQFDEKIIPDLILENKLSMEYDAVIGGAQIEYNGQIYNLSQMGKFAQSKDRQVRLEASKLSENFFKENDKKLGEIYDKMVQVRTSMAQKMGYKNFVEYGYNRLGRVDYNSEMVKGYRDQLYKSVLPVYKKIIKKQIARIGVENPVFCDLNLMFADGNATPKGSAAELVGYATTMYNQMSKETGEFFDFMKASNLLSLETQPGKAGGGYMTYLPVYKAPFIFSNFNGTSGDVDVLTHEFGHAFQGYLSRNINVPEYRMPTLEACEIHSMSMEFLAWPWMNLFFKEEDEKYKYSHLAGCITFLPYGALVDEFQHEVYEHPEMTHAERCATWRRLEKKWLPLKKYNGFNFYNKGTWWLKQGHIFGNPFYYIDYTLAQVVAFQFLNDNLKNSEKTWKKYVKLCKLGGKYPFLTLLEKAHLRNPFEDGNVKKAIRPLVKVLDSFKQF